MAQQSELPTTNAGPDPACIPSTRLNGNLNVWAIVFLVAAAAAPLGVMSGTIPIGISIGNGSAFPMTFVVSGIMLLIFAVGYTTLTKYVPNAGAFYAYIAKGLGNRIGLGSAFLAVVAYLAETIAVYGLLAAGADSLFVSWGVQLPWQLYALVAIGVVSYLGHRHIDVTAKVLGTVMILEVGIILILDVAVIVRGGGPEGFSTAFLDPSTVMSGAPGLALLFAFLSFLGVEATAVYRNEARDPNRTVPRATYLAISLIGVFYLVSTWALISAWGDSAAGKVAAENPVAMLPEAMKSYVGAFAEQVTMVLFVSSLFACVLAFHNIVSRYIFTLAGRGALPKRLGYAHTKHGSPYLPSALVSVTALVAIGIASAVGLDPVSQVYTWLAGACTVGFIFLLISVSLSSIPFFLRQRAQGTLNEKPWGAFIAPAISAVLLIGTFALVMMNLSDLVGGPTAAVVVMAILLAAYVVGIVVAVMRPEVVIDISEDENEVEPLTTS